MVPRKRFMLPQIVILWCFVPGKRFRWNQFYVSEIKHGGGRSSDSSAQVLRNSRLEFRLLPPSQHYVLQIPSRGRRNIMFFRYRLVAVATLCSSDIVSWPVGADAQRANCEAPERAGADSAGSHVNILCDIRCKWYQENVLYGTNFMSQR